MSRLTPMFICQLFARLAGNCVLGGKKMLRNVRKVTMGENWGFFDNYNRHTILPILLWGYEVRATPPSVRAWAGIEGFAPAPPAT
ncbi:hypothetical protein [Pseudoduganella namucuonensis]|uniref:hypothetical protein n=1 Tax=Pseudoduganella namucuonensis TaxID=1035707 RepID=UPI00116055FC|nr:hypothetical protein [Pseudoduganella namucuonensis]